MTKEDFSLKPLQDAVRMFSEAIANVKDELDRDGAIQRFEYTFELAWKSLKRYFEHFTGFSDDNIKNILREAGKQGLISSVEDWFDYQKGRNLSSHSYSGKVAKNVFEIAVRFEKDVISLLEKLENIVGNTASKN